MAILTYIEFETLCLTCLTTLFSANTTIFTLTIIFLLNKKETLRLLLKQIQETGISLTLSNKFNSAQEYIDKMKYITTVSIIGFCSAIIAGIVYVVFLFLSQSYWILIILIPIFTSGSCCLIAIWKLLMWYFKK